MEIGANAWNDFDDVAYPEFEGRVHQCIQSTKWPNLIRLCSGIRGGVKCTISDTFTVGTINLIRLVEFEDGVKWVARMSLRDFTEQNAGNPSLMQTHDATAKYLRTHTSIPAPLVHGYSDEQTDEVGPPFMLLDYIHGSPADRYCSTEEQISYVEAQMADIIVALALCKFDRIGSLFLKPQGGFEIGRDAETDYGPFATAQDYYNRLSLHRFSRYAERHFLSGNNAEDDASLQLPFMFHNLMPILNTCVAGTEAFPLTIKDFSFHSVLIDAQFKIVGILGLDSIISAPIYVVAQVPDLSGICVPIPGLVMNDEKLKQAWDNGVARFNRFRSMIANAEKSIGVRTPITDAMASDGARLVYGFNTYCSYQGWANTQIAKGFWDMYYGALKNSLRSVNNDYRDRHTGQEFPTPHRASTQSDGTFSKWSSADAPNSNEMSEQLQVVKLIDQYTNCSNMDTNATLRPDINQTDRAEKRLTRIFGEKHATRNCFFNQHLPAMWRISEEGRQIPEAVNESNVKVHDFAHHDEGYIWFHDGLLG